MTKLRTQLDENQKHLNNITQEKGVSNWLKAYPISDQGYDFNKQQFLGVCFFTLWLEINEHSINM